MADHHQLHSTDALVIQGGFAVVATELIPYLEPAIWQISGAQEVNQRFAKDFRKPSILLCLGVHPSPSRCLRPTKSNDPMVDICPDHSANARNWSSGETELRSCPPAWRTPRGSTVVSTAVCTCRPFAGSRSRGCGVYA